MSHNHIQHTTNSIKALSSTLSNILLNTGIIVDTANVSILTGDNIIGKVKICDSNGDAINTTGGNLMVIVDSGSIEVSNQVETTNTILDGCVSNNRMRISDFYGDPILTTSGHLMVAISNIYTSNPLHCIIDSLPQGTNNIGKVMTIIEPPLSVLNITSITEGTSIQILPNSGSILSFSPTNEGVAGALCWYKFYNKLSATQADTPIFKYAITSSMNNTISQINLNNLVFDTALSVRATLNYIDNDNTAPIGTQSLFIILNADYS